MADGVPFQLRQRPSQAYVRRIYVDQELVVPAYRQANVPVKVTRHNPYVGCPNWMVETNEFKTGVITARTLLAGDAPCTSYKLHE